MKANHNLYQTKEVIEIFEITRKYPVISEIFENCFWNTLDTTTKILADGSSYIFTGDIPAMWLRDSSAQVRHYVRFCNDDNAFCRLIEGLIKKQIQYIQIDPYANAFNETANGAGHTEDKPQPEPWVWERKYEIDSLCAPIELAYIYYKQTGNQFIFDDAFKKACNTIIELFITEQNHCENSPYRFQRFNCAASDTLANNGLGTPVAYCGLTWSGFRPSDDACEYGYLIPSNMYATVILGYISEIAKTIYNDEKLNMQATQLQNEIEKGIQTFGVIKHPVYGNIYAYEVDGQGNHKLMDDANVPSLLSIPYIGYRNLDDEIYKNTRKYILSENNPYYFSGNYAKGVGSPHTPNRHIWPIGLLMQALTSDSDEEQKSLIEMIISTDAGTKYMHESFNVDNPNTFTRDWFAWANSLFAETLIRLLPKYEDIF